MLAYSKNSIIKIINTPDNSEINSFNYNLLRMPHKIIVNNKIIDQLDGKTIAIYDIYENTYISKSFDEFIVVFYADDFVVCFGNCDNIKIYNYLFEEICIIKYGTLFLDFYNQSDNMIIYIYGNILFIYKTDQNTIINTNLYFSNYTEILYYVSDVVVTVNYDENKMLLTNLNNSTQIKIICPFILNKLTLYYVKENIIKVMDKKDAKIEYYELDIENECFVPYSYDLITLSFFYKNNINYINFVEKGEEVYYLERYTTCLYKYDKKSDIITFIDNNVGYLFDVKEKFNNIW